MFLLWIFVVNLGHCYAAVENYPCAFLPNDSMKCIEYWTLKEMKHNCTDVKDDLMFTGLIKKVDGEHLISLRASSESLNFDVKTQIWVRRKDGFCENNCCGVNVKEKRFLLDGGLACITQFCLHGGHCEDGNCVCKPQYYGPHCGKWDPCHNKVCHNGGFCVYGFCVFGKNTDDTCAGIICKNGGSCNAGHCSCTTGFSGDQCQNYDPCHGVSCTRGGYCLYGVCYCHPNNQWEICENDPCHNVSCMKGGYCVKGVCYCPNNNQWLPCEHCLPNQCSGHGKCINLQTGFSCTCDTGYTGITCNTGMLIKYINT
ncbi:uncharacterized protein LOC143056132 [Mytilus galloprovincialis]|uniref:uncharacterized protein LOC143056132 n=1 Tax=Mytilus galloprovincialis TaxID=29158 RepID=UPI003F7BF860